MTSKQIEPAYIVAAFTILFGLGGAVSAAFAPTLDHAYAAVFYTAGVLTAANAGALLIAVRRARFDRQVEAIMLDSHS